MYSEDESGSCLDERSSEESNNCSPDEEMLYGAASNSFETESNVYDTSADPIATGEEHDSYLQVVAQREEELHELRSRLTGEKSTDLWYVTFFTLMKTNLLYYCLYLTSILLR
jgi:hypothetical protein